MLYIRRYKVIVLGI